MNFELLKQFFNVEVDVLLPSSITFPNYKAEDRKWFSGFFITEIISNHKDIEIKVCGKDVNGFFKYHDSSIVKPSEIRVHYSLFDDIKHKNFKIVNDEMREFAKLGCHYLDAFKMAPEDEVDRCHKCPIHFMNLRNDMNSLCIGKSRLEREELLKAFLEMI